MGFRVNILKILLPVISVVAYMSSARAGTFSVFENIVLKQNLITSAHRLCQDGLFIYFKSIEQCERAKSDIDCAKSLKIVPIQSAEKIYTSLGGPSLTRFFQVQLEYRHRLYEIEENKEDKLIFDLTRRLPYCEGRERHKTQNVGTWRYPESDSEKFLITSMIDSGLTLINTPIGDFGKIKNIGVNDYYDKEKKRVLLKTPFCNKGVSSDQIYLMSGEYSGTGSVRVGSLQSISMQMYLKETYYVVDEEKKEFVPRYLFSCVQIWDI